MISMAYFTYQTNIRVGSRTIKETMLTHSYMHLFDPKHSKGTLIRGGFVAPRSKPLPFYIPFVDRKGNPFRHIPSIENGTSFTCCNAKGNIEKRFG